MNKMEAVSGEIKTETKTEIEEGQKSLSFFLFINSALHELLIF